MCLYKSKRSLYFPSCTCLQPKRGNRSSHLGLQVDFLVEKVSAKGGKQPGGNSFRIPWGYFRGKYGKRFAVMGVLGVNNSYYHDCMTTKSNMTTTITPPSRCCIMFLAGPPPKKERRNGAAKEQHRAVDPSESIVENCADARSLGALEGFSIARPCDRIFSAQLGLTYFSNFQL